MTQPFNRVINWFKLSVERESIYKIINETENEEPENYFIRFNDEFYSLEPHERSKTIEFTGEIRKRCISKAFREALRPQGFSFKGRFGNIAYYTKSFLNRDYREIFGAYTAFEFRTWENFDGENWQSYLIIDPHIAFAMRASIHNLVVDGHNNRKLEGMSLENYAVRVTGESVQSLDEKLFGIDGTIVAMKRLSDTELVCEILDARNGKILEFPAQDVYLEPRPEILRDVVLKGLGINFDVIKLQRERSFLESSTAAKDRYLKTIEIVEKFLQQHTKTFPLSLGDNKVHISSKPEIIRGTGYPKHGTLKEPLLMFDKADSSAVHLQPYYGLKTFGAFTKDKPEIKVALLGTKYGVQQLKELLKNLNKGTSIMPEGMARFFNTKLTITEEKEIASPSLADYTDGAEILGTRCDAGNSGADIALIHLTQSTSYFNYNTPYYNVKPILLGHGISSQFVSEKTLRNPAWSYMNIGSAMFAKAGAYPWVLAEDIKEFDIILGVGLSQAISMTKRAGAKPRYIGYANVFDEQGRWMFFETTSEVYATDKPVEQIENLIGRAIENYRKIRDTLPKSIAIHYYQRFSNEKIEAVNNLLERIIGKDYRVAYITIDKSHPMRLYDLEIEDGSYPRAHFALLEENRLLLSTTGYTQLAKKRLGTPAPLNISARQYPNKFVEIESIAKHILALTRLNYKTLTPVVGEPVTLLFSNLAASFMATFSEAQFSNATANLSNKINRVPWFL